VLPSLVIRRGGSGRRGLHRVGDGGDQGDQLGIAVAVGELVLHDADVPGSAGGQLLPGAGGVDELLPGRGLGPSEVIRTER
jgi:hypothetical protein